MVDTPTCLSSAPAIILQCLYRARGLVRSPRLPGVAPRAGVRRMRGRWAALLLGLALSLPVGGMAFEVIDMATVFPGAFDTVVYGINNASTIVGSFVDGSGTTHGFVRIGLLISKIDVPGATDTVVLGLNNQDPPQIVGSFGDGFGRHGFVCVYPCSGSAIVPVDPPGAYLTAVHGINDAGVIVGEFTGGGTFGNVGLHGFESLGPFLATPVPQRFFVQWDLPGSTSGTVLYGINNAYTIVGSFTAGGKTIAFVRPTASGQFTQLDVSELAPPVGDLAEAYGITSDPNDLGTVIVGYYRNSFGEAHGLLVRPAAVRRSITVDVPVSGALGTRFLGVNEYFQAVGSFVDKDLVHHGFILDLATIIIETP